MRDDVAVIVTLVGVALSILGEGRPVVLAVGVALAIVGSVLLIAGALRGPS
jgi:hypothetical protein